MRKTPRRHWLFRFTIEAFKYFLLSLFAMGIACLLAALFNGVLVLEVLMSLWKYFFRVGAVLFCLLAIAVLIESLRS